MSLAKFKSGSRARGILSMLLPNTNKPNNVPETQQDFEMEMNELEVALGASESFQRYKAAHQMSKIQGSEICLVELEEEREEATRLLHEFQADAQQKYQQFTESQQEIDKLEVLVKTLDILISETKPVKIQLVGTQQKRDCRMYVPSSQYQPPDCSDAGSKIIVPKVLSIDGKGFGDTYPTATHHIPGNCILADAADINRAKQIELEYMCVDDLKKLRFLKVNKNQKLAKKDDAFLASEALINQIPRLVSPRLESSPPVSHAEDLTNKPTEVRSTIKFQLKKVLCLGVAVGHVQVNDDEVLGNVMLSINFLVSLLKKNWQNVKSLHIKTIMGKPVRLY
ncbi:60S ribosomal protein L1-B [Psilocybe cubensis]|uniref:60S ribosomal protein L1-B n=1 Tax=Psilocybe cubensis TaxID=181762 RepID=A0ACB8GKP5_PSICU|nr:60S ribosomal protein L1-B [Psilocybe cubensis]KAH9476069.1 60S ribosomal protein L1-B [Psilocybe cubensis]